MKLVTIFERLDAIHINKDVGQVPMTMSREFGYVTEIWRLNGKSSLSAEGVKIIDIKGKFQGRLKISFNLLLKLIKEAKNIDVLNLFHHRHYSIFYASVYKVINPKGIVVLKGDYSASESARISDGKRKLLNRIAKRNIDYILCEHSSVKNELDRLGFSTFLMPNGYSYQLESIRRKVDIKKPEIFTAVSVGTIGDPRKDNESAIEALLALPTDLQWRAYFVGPIAPMFYEKMVARHGDDSRFNEWINFTGSLPTEKLAHILSSAHVFLLTSTFEGYPLATVEACLFECVPIVGRNCGADDLIENGVDGYIYHNQKELEETLLYCLNQRNWLLQAGRNIQAKVVQKNSWSKNLRRFNTMLLERIHK